MRWLLKQLAFNVLKLVAGAAVLGLCLGLAWNGYLHWREAEAVNPQYARDVFDGLLPFRRVIASRKYHAPDAEPWDCTFAIVELDANAPEFPPSSGREVYWNLRFGGDWQPSPEPELRDNIRRALSFCAPYWDDDVNDRLTRALTMLGNWYMRGPVGENLHIYSQPLGIAARIRFGD